MIRLDFFGGSGLSSKAIEWFSAGGLSHVAAVWSETEYLDSHVDTIAGIKPGVQIRPQILETPELKLQMELETTADEYMLWRAFLESQLSKPYDKGAIWGFATGRDWREPDSWMCSELQSAALEQSGICPPLYAPTNRITPVALATIVSALGGVVLPSR